MQIEELIRAAQENTGLKEFDSDSFREPLEILVSSMSARDDYSETGRETLRSEIVNHLSNRLRVADYLRQHPELQGAPLVEPVIIMGMPRTGTTIVSYLMDCDPRWRSLLNWEAVDSIPPPTTETLRSDPRCVAKKQLQKKIFAAVPQGMIPHWEWADGPTECIFVQSQDFKSLMWEARMPSPEYSEYILTCDMSTAYEYEKKVLRILQSKAPGRWVLKMPSHALHFESALKAFPDSRFVWTHRNPFKALASLGTTIAAGHMGSLVEIDRQHIHDVYPQQIAEHANRPMRACARLPEDKILDVYWAEFLRDPIAGMRRIYQWLGEELTEDLEGAMRAWLEQDDERQAKRPHYTLEDFGWSREEVAPYFEEYLASYPQAEGA
jgi:Sulfotransferase family